MSGAIVFRYKAMNTDGSVISDTLLAEGRKDALQQLGRTGFTVIEIVQVDASNARQSGGRGTASTEALRIAALKQLALMLNAGVDLLDALNAISGGLGGQLATELDEVALGLRRGGALGKGFRENVKGFPDYVYAMIELGESTGRLSQVLKDACAQMEFEAGIKREMSSALTYPIFLMAAGLIAVTFLFYEVVPRFSAMLGENRSNVDGLGALVLSLGEAFRKNTLVVAASAAGGVFLAGSLISMRPVREKLQEMAAFLPVVGPILKARQRALWGRMMAFSLSSGLGILEATALSLSTTSNRQVVQRLEKAIGGLRKGQTVEQAFAATGLLQKVDISLLRAGEKSGALREMFTAIADSYEANLRTSLKRATALIEPISIGLVSLIIGGVALGLVSAMSSLYTGIE